ncbi:MAG TPA: class I SAM-dependent methyltransferase [Vicinamibacterales bacterium]|nr:class I SAM-dependent methyltransferase [Vicinamibacterales bacterium]
MTAPSFDTWLEALERRHLADLTRPELTRALRALSSSYVERRASIARGAALEGAGKRAAFALYYAPLHFLVAREVVGALHLADQPISRVVDLGCGTGAASAGWAAEASSSGPIRAVSIDATDRSSWAVDEAVLTYRHFEVRARVRAAHLRQLPLRAGAGDAVLLAYTVNELPPDARDPLLEQLCRVAARGAAVLVIEPIARRMNEWWADWARALQARQDDWRFSTPVPPRLREIGRAAGLDPRELTARTLWVPGVRPKA